MSEYLDTAIDNAEALMTQRYDSLRELEWNLEKLNDKDREFAHNLINSFANLLSLSPKQWEWVDILVGRAVDWEPLYGDFAAVMVMFQIAGDHLKVPKIRLLTKSDRFVQLNFDTAKNQIKVYVDGWQGHGVRKFAGLIGNLSKDGAKIFPYRKDCMTEEVRLLLQEFSLDPEQVSKTMANRLGCCIYCGSRLADPESKSRGYGPTCADHYGLPWGKRLHRVTNPITEETDLSTLFIKEKI